MKKTIAVILLASVFTLYGCAATASDNGSSVSDTSAPAENTAESTVVTTEATPEKTLEDAKTVGEALEILYPDITFDVDNIVSLFIDSDIYDDKYASVEDDETIADILDTLRNAPVVKCESKQAVPGAPAQIKFNDGDGRLPVTATVEESAVVFDYGAYVLTVNDGYFTELCHFIDTVENVSEAASTDTAEEPMSYDDYLGVWYLNENENRADRIIITNITPKRVDFEFSLFREFDFYTTAIAYDNVYYFGEQYVPDSVPQGISGRIVFEDGTITITFDSFGAFEDIHSSNIMEYTFAEKTKNLFDEYLGYWYLDEYKADSIHVTDITSEKVDFEFGLFREFGFHTTAIAYDNVYYFGEQYGSGASLPQGISGRIVFEAGTITITFDSFGVFEDIHYSNIMEYTFTEKTTEYFDVCLD